MKRLSTLAVLLAIGLAVSAQSSTTIAIWQNIDGDIQDTVITLYEAGPDAEWELDLDLEEGIRPTDIVANEYYPELRDSGEVKVFIIANPTLHQQEGIVIENINYSAVKGNTDTPENWRDLGDDKANKKLDPIEVYTAHDKEGAHQDGKRYIPLIEVYYPEKHDAGEPATQRKIKVMKVVMKPVSKPEAEALNISSDRALHIEGLSVYPNPCQGQLQVTFDSPRRGHTSIAVFNVSGQRVYQQDLGEFTGQYQGQVDISGQESGIYFLTITQDGQSLTQKVILTN